MGIFSGDPWMITARILALFIAIPFHECAHAFISDKLGDHTARNAGRLTLNPLKHIDPMGLLSMLLIGVGWAKPVPVDTRYYKNQKRGMALSALAGPVSNLLLGFYFTILDRAFVDFYNGVLSAKMPDLAAALYGAANGFEQILFYLVVININLAIFNLLPIPPLDGSRIFGIVLPDKIYFGVMKYERFIMFGVLALMWLGAFSGILGTLNGYVLTAFDWATNWVDAVFQFLY